MIERLRGWLNAVSFGRGLALGALVGAAIAGSTIWSRLRGDVRDGGDRAERAGKGSTTEG